MLTSIRANSLCKSSFVATAFAAASIVAAFLPSHANAAGLTCNGNCSWSIDVDGTEVGSGWYEVDAKTGDITLSGPQTFSFADGSSVGVNNMSGNIDPILGFSVAAGTAAIGKSFAFNFSLPIALSGPIDANSSVSYSLTSLSAAGAQVTPLFGKTVVAQEVDTSIGGIGVLNKGVDVGNTFGFTGGPLTQNSPVYTAVNFFTGNLAYDLMSVTVAFGLSANSNVGVSGFVQQLPVPLPAAAWLLLSGLSVLGLVRRKR
jgi:hypothetical protein